MPAVNAGHRAFDVRVGQEQAEYSPAGDFSSAIHSYRCDEWMELAISGPPSFAGRTAGSLPNQSGFPNQQMATAASTQAAAGVLHSTHIADRVPRSGVPPPHRYKPQPASELKSVPVAHPLTSSPKSAVAQPAGKVHPITEHVVSRLQRRSGILGTLSSTGTTGHHCDLPRHVPQMGRSARSMPPCDRGRRDARSHASQVGD